MRMKCVSNRMNCCSCCDDMHGGCGNNTFVMCGGKGQGDVAEMYEALAWHGVRPEQLVGFERVLSASDIPSTPVKGRVYFAESEGKLYVDLGSGLKAYGGSGGTSTGTGLPAGGLSGQVLKKFSNADGDANWQNETVQVVNSLSGNETTLAPSVAAVKAALNQKADLVDGKIPEYLFPPNVKGLYRGAFATSAALIAAHPTDVAGAYATVTATGTMWLWNDTAGAWQDSGIAGPFVESVNGKVGPNVVLDYGDVGAAAVDHTHAGLAARRQLDLYLPGKFAESGATNMALASVAEDASKWMMERSLIEEIRIWTKEGDATCSVRVSVNGSLIGSAMPATTGWSTHTVGNAYIDTGSDVEIAIVSAGAKTAKALRVTIVAKVAG